MVRYRGFRDSKKDKSLSGISGEKKRLKRAVISLALASVTLLTSTYCWFQNKSSFASTDSNGIVFDTDNGLRMNDVEKDLKSLTDNAYLIPASSVDGRNIYFPADGNDFSTVTEAMTFRNANAGDKNFYYLQYDFELTAEEDATSIYIKNGTDPDDNRPYTDICFSDEANKPPSERTKSRAIRAAVFYDGMEDNKPIVFNTRNTSVTTNAVDTVDRTDGSFMATSLQTSVPFKDYMYGKKVLATLNRGETRRFSLIIWLEGTIKECTEELIGKKIDIKIDFTTSWDFIDTIVFQDDTGSKADTDGGNIVTYLDTHPGYSLVLNYNNKERNITNHRFPMYKYSNDGRGDQWYAKIPRSATNDLTFEIVDNNNNVITDVYTYEWSVNQYGQSTKNRFTSEKYIADGIDPAPYGHWYDGEIEGGGDGRDDGDNGGSVGVGDDDW